MKIIAHRGNLHGPNPSTENKPNTILRAIAMGLECEIDVWYVNGQYYLGHDYPETPVTYHFLEFFKESLWIHCKHLDALVQLKDTFNCFYHDKDIYTLTSKGYIWGNINSPTHSKVVQVMPEKSGTFSPDCYAICTDYAFRWSK